MQRLITALSIAVLAMSTALAQQSQKIIHNAKNSALVQEGFTDAGSIKGEERLARIKQDDIQSACSDIRKSFGGKNGMNRYYQLAQTQKAAIVYPANDQYLGDWKEGEKLAQSGRGLTWSDNANTPTGGGCYNCHQISPKELSFGTIGPSLYLYGKNKGNLPENLKDTWARIYNSKSFNACSWMPRFGHNKILTEQQLKDLMALLHDPESPVNK